MQPNVTNSFVVRLWRMSTWKTSSVLAHLPFTMPLKIGLPIRLTTQLGLGEISIPHNSFLLTVYCWGLSCRCRQLQFGDLLPISPYLSPIKFMLIYGQVSDPYQPDTLIHTFQPHELKLRIPPPPYPNRARLHTPPLGVDKKRVIVLSLISCEKGIYFVGIWASLYRLVRLLPNTNRKAVLTDNEFLFLAPNNPAATFGTALRTIQ